MKFEFTDEQLKYKDEFRTFVDEHVVPYAAINDREEILRKEVIDALIEKSYLGTMISKEYEGLGLDMVTIGILNEELGRGCSATRSLITVHGMVALGIQKWASEELKRQWLPKLAKGEALGAFALSEPDAGSDAKSIKTSAELLNDGSYILNGTKKWITMGQIADIFIIFAKCNGAQTAFLVDKNTAGLKIKAINGLLGVRGSMLAEIELKDCIVPQSNILARVGSGLSHVALTCLDYGRYSIACGCVGIGQAALEESVKYSNSRVQFDDVIGKNQLILKMITEMVVNIKAARLLCYNAGYLKDVLDPDSIMETWNAKYFASNMLNKVVSDAVQIHGGNGCIKNYNVERFFRDGKINEIIEGSTQVHEILIGKNALKVY